MSARNSLDASRGGASGAVDDGSDSSSDTGSRPSSSSSDPGGGGGGSSSTSSSSSSSRSIRDRVSSGVSRVRNRLDPRTNARTDRSGNDSGGPSDGASSSDRSSGGSSSGNAGSPSTGATREPPDDFNGDTGSQPEMDSEPSGPERTRPGSTDNTGAAPDAGTPDRPTPDTSITEDDLANRTQTGSSNADPAQTNASGAGSGARPASDAVVGQIISQNTELFTTSGNDPDGGPLTRDDITVTRQPDGSVDVQVSEDGRRALAAARGQDAADRARLQGAADDFVDNTQREQELEFANRREDIDQNTQTPIEGAAQDFVDNSRREQELAGRGQSTAADDLFGGAAAASGGVLDDRPSFNSGTANSGPIQPDLGGGREVTTDRQRRLANIEQQIESETGQNVDVSVAEDGSLSVTPEEQFGDNAVGIPGTNITFEELTGQLARGGRERIGDAANAAVNLPGRVANPNRGAFDDLTAQPQGAVPNIAAGTVEGVASLPLLALDTARTVDEGVELAAFTARETVNPGELSTSGPGGSIDTDGVVDADRGSEILNDLGGAATTAATGAVDSVKASPFRTGGVVVGSLGGTAAAFRATANAGRLGTATRYAIQPGEELAGAAGFRATRATFGRSTADRFFPNGEPLFLSEEAAIAGGRRVLGGARSAANRVRNTDVSVTSNNRIGSGLGAFEVEVSRSEAETETDSNPAEGIMIDGEIVELPDSISSTDPDTARRAVSGQRRVGNTRSSDLSFRYEAEELDTDTPLLNARETREFQAAESEFDQVPETDIRGETATGRDRTQIREETQSDFFRRPGPEAGARGIGGVGETRESVDVLSEVTGEVEVRNDLDSQARSDVGAEPFADIFGETSTRTEIGGRTESRVETETRQELAQETETATETATESLLEPVSETETETESELALESEQRGRREAFGEEENRRDSGVFGDLFGSTSTIRDSGIASGEDALDELTGL